MAKLAQYERNNLMPPGWKMGEKPPDPGIPMQCLPSNYTSDNIQNYISRRQGKRKRRSQTSVHIPRLSTSSRPHPYACANNKSPVTKITHPQVCVPQLSTAQSQTSYDQWFSPEINVPLGHMSLEHPLYGPPSDCLSYISPVPGGFENLTEYKIDTDISTLLSFGPKFVPPARPSFGDYIDHLLILDRYSQECHPTIDPSSLLGEYLRTIYAFLAEATVVPFNPLEKKLQLMAHKTLIFLRNHKDILLLQSDKAKSLVLIPKTVYHSKMNTWVSRQVSLGYYASIPLVRASQLKKLWYKRYQILLNQLGDNWRQTVCVPKEKENGKTVIPPYPYKYQQLLRVLDTQPLSLPYMYGTVKTHKPDQPCRPIVSTRGWYTYPVAKIVTHILGRVMKTFLCPQNVCNIDTVALSIREILICPNYKFVKIDVENMYPNMNRTDILYSLEHFLSLPCVVQCCPVEPKLLLACIRFCLNEYILFTYGGQIYHQVQGLPQGACDSGLLATIYLDHRFQIHYYNIFIANGIVHWHKYIDDILLYIPTQQLDSLLEALQEATSLTFTVDQEDMPDAPKYIYGSEVKGAIDFLDIQCHRTTTRAHTSLYRKSMCSDRVCHYLSNTKMVHKESTLTHYIRKVLVRSTNHFLLSDLKTVISIFIHNMYPLTLIHKVISKLVTIELRKCAAVNNAPRHKDYRNTLGGLKIRMKLLNSCLEPLGSLPGQSDVPSNDPSLTLMSAPKYKALHALGSHTMVRNQYRQSLPYICEDYGKLITLLCREFQLGDPTFHNSNSLFHKLKMGMSQVDPTIVDHNSKVENIGLLKCPDCPTVFILAGERALSSISSTACDDPNSLISHHVRLLNHRYPMTPVPLRIPSTTDTIMSTDLYVPLLRATLENMGYNSISSKQVQLLPRIIQMGIRYIFRTQSNMLNNYLPLKSLIPLAD
ncbi:uncharacterized protein LOC142242497 isoform X2 [Haematobia irritans]|uniref:uncharacterized protein LOC142242495 isoform X2 n=1 Tax=Haematobia irritans TaxID=7368 RepID=UPI003F50955B